MKHVDAPDPIDLDALDDAYASSKWVAGMGAVHLKLSWNPYECRWAWTASIDFADGTEFRATADNSRDALLAVAKATREGLTVK